MPGGRKMTQKFWHTIMFGNWCICVWIHQVAWTDLPTTVSILQYLHFATTLFCGVFLLYETNSRFTTFTWFSIINKWYKAWKFMCFITMNIKNSLKSQQNMQWGSDIQQWWMRGIDRDLWHKSIFISQRRYSPTAKIFNHEKYSWFIYIWHASQVFLIFLDVGYSMHYLSQPLFMLESLFDRLHFNSLCG